MIDDIYVLDRDLQVVGLIDTYKSVIWANRYNDLGDCELMVPVSEETMQLLQPDFYLYRLDDDMVCQIKTLQLDTDEEVGDYLIATGVDVKSFLDQRIIWGTMMADGNAEQFLIDMVDGSLGASAAPERQIRNSQGALMFQCDAPQGFTEAATGQSSYRNIGEKMRESCKEKGWGYRVRLEDDVFCFSLYQGADRSDSVFFSKNYENLCTTTYIQDKTNLGTVALVAGEGEGAAREKRIAGGGSGVDRHEVYVDAKDIASNITFADLKAAFPPVESGGQGRIVAIGSPRYVYRLDQVDIQILDEAHSISLSLAFPSGEIISVNGVDYYRAYDAVVADVYVESPEDTDGVKLWQVIYLTYLAARGYEKLAEYGAETSFTGGVEPNTTFVYKRDYFLGDLVTVENEYGITMQARITEVVESNDDTGYKLEPKFEFYKLEA